MRDEDDGMNDMNESYQRYMMTTLDSSRSGFCEEEDSVVGSVTDIGIERKNSKVSYTYFRVVNYPQFFF